MKELTFEQALKRLETLVAELEKGQMSLEKSLEAFEEGVRLARFCGQRLEEAEKRVQVLVESGEGESRLELFPEGEEPDSDV